MPLEGAVYYGEEHLGRPGRRPEAIDDDEDEDGNGACAACCRRCGTCFRSCILTMLIFLGMAAGIGVGIVLRYIPPYDQPQLHPRYSGYLAYPTELFARFTGFLLVPFVVSSLVTGCGSLRAASSAKVGLRTLTYYVATSVLAVGEALGFVYAIRPGNRNVEKQLVRDAHLDRPALEACDPVDVILDLFRNLIPENIVTSLLYVQHTKPSTISVEAPNGTKVNVESFSLERTESVNIVGIAFFSIIFGLALAKLGDKGRLTQLFFAGVCEAILTVIRGVLWLYPIIAIFSMSQTIISLSEPLSQLVVMFMFSLTVLLGLFTHMFLVLPVIYVIFTRKNPFRLLYYVFRALLVGFITNSSTVTIPVTVDCLDNAGVDPRIVRWMCPIGAIINVDGFAIYEAMACVFIATVRGVAFDAATIAVLGFMTVAISLIRPVSGGSWAIFLILFRLLGLPVQDIYLLLPFDWMLARFRTVVSIWSDAIGSGIVDKCSHADLNRADGGGQEERGCVVGLNPPTDGAVLTGYGKRKDWTVRLVNPYGDRMVVSKV